MTAGRRRPLLVVAGAVMAVGLGLAAYMQVVFNHMYDVARYNLDGYLAEPAAWQSDLVTQTILLAIGILLLMLGAITLAFLLRWQLRFLDWLLTLVVVGGAFWDWFRAVERHTLAFGLYGPPPAGEVSATVGAITGWLILAVAAGS